MSLSCGVVITGMGVVSPLGTDTGTFWSALTRRVSGVRVREEFAGVRHPFRIAAEVRDFEARNFVRPRKALKVMCRPIQYGFAASTQAVDQSGIAGQVDPERFSTVFGTEAFYADPEEVALVFRKCIVNRCYDHSRWGEYAMREIEPLWMLKYLPNMVASHISIACDARGPSNTICQAEASSLLAIIEAIDLIRRGAADAAIAGGTGSLLATTGMIYRGLHRLSKRIDEPEQASRPFDLGRDGMVAGEGAAAFVLEREDFARARGVRPIARILGFDRGFAPGASMEQAIASTLETSLRRAELTPADLGHCNAHGFSTPEDDIREARGIAKSLGDVPVIAPKSNFGNPGPGTGSLELLTSVQACRTGLLPPVLNLEQQDPECPIRMVDGEGLRSNHPTAVTLNFTETGQFCSLVLETPDGSGTTG
jgi:3-oxoacyl-[acyl-carrier-protein] synthase II